MSVYSGNFLPKKPFMNINTSLVHLSLLNMNSVFSVTFRVDSGSAELNKMEECAVHITLSNLIAGNNKA